MEALQRLHNRGSISTGYDIDNSCKFEDDNDEYLYRTNASGTNRKTWTVSWWFKQTEIPSTRSSYVEHWQGGVYGEATRAGIDNNDRLWIDVGGGDGNTGTLFRSLSTARLRDASAWYHVVIACDSTQSTEADRLKVWLNGVEVTSWDQHQIPTLNFQSALQGTGGVVMKWGSYDATYNGYSGYLAECNYVDGVTATQNDFGEFDSDSGIWKPKEYTGSYGTNGSYLDFKTASDLGANAKGNDTNFSLNNITSADQATDTPTNNFCIFNVLQNNTTSGTNPTFTEGATVVNRSTGAGWMVYITTIPVNKGKWYAEFELERTNALQMQGTLPVDYAQTGATTTEYYLGAQANGDGGVGWYGSGSNVYHGGGYTSSTAADGGDIIGVAIDCDNNKVHFRVNATWTNSSNPASGNSGGFAINDELTYMVLCSQPASRTYKANFGGYTTIDTSGAYTGSDADGYGTFKFAPPSGYYALCTKNLEEYG